MKLQKQTEAQKRANARNLLFRQIYGYNLGYFINKAKAEDVITAEKIECLDKIQDILSSLKQKYFDNSKKLGLHPRRRCFCGNTARWRCIDILDNVKYLCNEHKAEWEKDSIVYCERINPYD